MKDEFLAMAFRLSPHPMGVTELETGRCLDINNACLEIFGFRRDEVIGQTTLVLGIWPDPQDRARLIERLKAELSVRNLEVSMRTKQGTLRHFLISTELVMLGRRRCVVTVGHDITERKQVESALRESEERFRTLVSNIPGAVFRCRVDEHWTTAYVSEAIEEIVGYPAAQFMDRTRSYAGVIHPDDRSHVDETVRKALRERRPYTIEYRIIHAGGAIRWVSEKGQGGFAPDAGVCFLDGAIFDITEHKRAEDTLRGVHDELERRVRERTGALERANAALSDSEERFRTFLDHAPNLAFIKATDGRYLYANRRFMEAFRLDQNSIIGKTDAELFPPGQADEYQTNDRRLLETEQAMEFEEVGRYTDGLHTNIVVKFPVRDGLGHIYAMGGIVTDITDRKNAEDELRRSQAFTASMIDNLPNMVFVKDAKDLRFARLNKAGERLLGYSERELLGKNDYDFFSQAEADFCTANDRETLATGRLLDIPEEPIKTRNGVIRLLHTKKIPIRDPEGRPLYLLGISEDITDQKRAEEELRKSQEELRQHRAQLQDLTSKLINAQESERQRISRELHDDFSQRMAVLVLDMASLEQQPPLLPELIGQGLASVREGLEQLSDDLHHLAYRLHPSLLQHAGLQPAIEDHIHSVIERTGLRIILTAKDFPGKIPIEWSTCLFRVLQESLQNIAKHAKATDVLVKLSGSSRGVGLSVKDNGRGFDLSEESAHQRGLGLVSMQERLRLVNGSLRIHSKPAYGTKVCAWIPFTKDEL